MSATAAHVQADDKYPSKAIQVVLPIAPGGDTDVNARVFNRYLEKELGKPLVAVSEVKRKSRCSRTNCSGFSASTRKHVFVKAGLPAKPFQCTVSSIFITAIASKLAPTTITFRHSETTKAAVNSGLCL
ncbi:hypothetical protein [Phytopseudomonas daroniae]|uniref:hypothetical protein n=1 Tax=Pseudomonadaceae TaxID=135621 RepID=UPI001A954C3B|nr:MULTISPECIES: hypothetical protein [Pseudomonas]